MPIIKNPLIVTGGGGLSDESFTATITAPGIAQRNRLLWIGTSSAYTSMDSMSYKFNDVIVPISQSKALVHCNGTGSAGYGYFAVIDTSGSTPILGTGISIVGSPKSVGKDRFAVLSDSRILHIGTSGSEQALSLYGVSGTEITHLDTLNVSTVVTNGYSSTLGAYIHGSLIKKDSNTAYLISVNTANKIVMTTVTISNDKIGVGDSTILSNSAYSYGAGGTFHAYIMGEKILITSYGNSASNKVLLIGFENESPELLVEQEASVGGGSFMIMNDTIALSPTKKIVLKNSSIVLENPPTTSDSPYILGLYTGGVGFMAKNTNDAITVVTAHGENTSYLSRFSPSITPGDVIMALFGDDVFCFSQNASNNLYAVRRMKLVKSSNPTTNSMGILGVSKDNALDDEPADSIILC